MVVHVYLVIKDVLGVLGLVIRIVWFVGLGIIMFQVLVRRHVLNILYLCWIELAHVQEDAVDAKSSIPDA